MELDTALFRPDHVTSTTSMGAVWRRTSYETSRPDSSLVFDECAQKRFSQVSQRHDPAHPELNRPGVG